MSQELREQLLAEQAGHQITYNHMKKKLRRAEAERDKLRGAWNAVLVWTKPGATGTKGTATALICDLHDILRAADINPEDL